jgi:hypothetical protein
MRRDYATEGGKMGTMFPRSLRQAVLAALAGLICLGAVPAQALGVGYSVSAVLLSSRCDYSWTWYGTRPGAYTPDTTQNTGTFDFCYQLAKVGTAVYDSKGNLTAVNGADQDGYEYYIFTTTTTFRTSVNNGYSDNRARMRFAVNKTSPRWDASDSTGSPWAVSCWSVGTYAGVGGTGMSAGVSLSHTFCNGTGLSLDSSSSSAAQWSTPDVRNAPRFENAFVAKYPKGTRPTFTAYLDYPYYSSYTAQTSCGTYSCTKLLTKYAYRTDPWQVTAKF